MPVIQSLGVDVISFADVVLRIVEVGSGRRDFILLKSWTGAGYVQIEARR